MSDSGASETTYTESNESQLRTRVPGPMRHPVAQRTSSSPYERARDAMLRRRSQVKIDCTQLTVRQPDSGNDRARQRETDPRKPAGSTQSSISLGTGRCVALRSRRDCSQQDRLEQADRREAQLQESRNTLLDGTPQKKAQTHVDALQ